MLFAAVKVGRFAGIDPEEAIAGTCEKFIHRFRAVEDGAREQGRAVEELSLDGGELLVEGHIDGLNFEDAPARKGSFFSRLLG